ncbi:hypothetical protein PUN28_006978 [Cardiocondyla obscurior]|uniref:Ribosomal protein S12 n=1 Tax=Cardiocondyla obscurior TaxID=286306 RepID=A0AAW2G5R3_9HYME
MQNSRSTRLIVAGRHATRIPLWQPLTILPCPPPSLCQGQASQIRRRSLISFFYRLPKPKRKRKERGKKGKKKEKRKEPEKGRDRKRKRGREKTGVLVISREMRVNKKVNGLTARRVQRSRVPKFIVRSCPPHGLKETRQGR